MNKIYSEIYEQAKESMANNIKNSNISIDKLAKMTGLSQSTIRNVVNKKGNIKTPTMIKLSRALNMTIEEFISRKNSD